MKRFYYVIAPRCRVLHMAAKRMNGDPTYCGARLRKGWIWWSARNWRFRHAPIPPRCKRCERAESGRR